MLWLKPQEDAADKNLPFKKLLFIIPLSITSECFHVFRFLHRVEVFGNDTSKVLKRLSHDTNQKHNLNDIIIYSITLSAQNTCRTYEIYRNNILSAFVACGFMKTRENHTNTNGKHYCTSPLRFDSREDRWEIITAPTENTRNDNDDTSPTRWT